mmetsp:Transcript_28307/g.39500  ORF Transcript_28307/g.39500 Transcript_28307/m.39500 type:complete len:142 (+) Transcript_28307:438-863(+)
MNKPYVRYKELQQKKAAQNVAAGKQLGRKTGGKSRYQEVASSSSSTTTSARGAGIANNKETRLNKAITKFLQNLSPDRKIDKNQMHKHLRVIGLAENLSNVSYLEPGDISGDNNRLGLKILEARCFCRIANTFASVTATSM